MWEPHGLNLVGRFGLRRVEVIGCGLAAALLGALILPAAGAWPAVFSGVLLFVAGLIVLIDGRHFIIPDVLSLPLIPIGLAASVVSFPEDPTAILVDRLAATGVAAGVLFGVRALYFRVRGLEGLGLGDVKLAGAAGAWVGLQALAATCLLASLAALAAVAVMRLRKGETAFDPLTPAPFGCFIAPAILVIWLYNLLGI